MKPLLNIMCYISRTQNIHSVVQYNIQCIIVYRVRRMQLKLLRIFVIKTNCFILNLKTDDDLEDTV